MIEVLWYWDIFFIIALFIIHMFFSQVFFSVPSKLQDRNDMVKSSICS